MHFFNLAAKLPGQQQQMLSYTMQWLTLDSEGCIRNKLMDMSKKYYDIFHSLVTWVLSHNVYHFSDKSLQQGTHMYVYMNISQYISITVHK